MRLATLRNGRPDGELVVVSADGARYLSAPGLTLLAAIEDWAGRCRRSPAWPHWLMRAGRRAGRHAPAAPLPRTWQWLDGSAFNQHGELMQIAFNLPPIETDRPLMYQGVSDRFTARPTMCPSPARPTASISKANSA
jgi:fumarylacetoacetate (FAA) hydrolase